MAWIACQKGILLVADVWETWLFWRINVVNSKIEQIGKDQYGMTNLLFILAMSVHELIELGRIDRIGKDQYGMTN